MRIPILVTLAVFGALMHSTVAGAAAPSVTVQTLEGLFGAVSAISINSEATSITLETDTGPVEITATAATSVRIPGLGTASALDLAVGDSVAVRARVDNGTARLALDILVRPDQPVRTRHFIGVVTSVNEDGTLGIQDRHGNRIVASWLSDSPDLRPGELVTAALDHDLRAGFLLITGLDRAVASLDRIQAALEQSQQSQAADTLEALRGRLAESAAQHLTILESISHRAAAALQDRIRQERDSAQSAYAAALSRFQAGRPSAQLSGTIDAIDTQRRLVTIVSQDLGARQVLFAEDTSIRFQGQEILFRELDLGNRVIVRYELDDDSAVWVNVLAGEVLRPGLADVLLPMARSGATTGTMDGPAVGPGEAALSGLVHSFIAKVVPNNFSILTLDKEVLIFNHTAETIVRRNGRQVSINEVEVGDLVSPGTRYLTGPGTGYTEEAAGGSSPIAGQLLVVLDLKSPGPASIRGTVRGIALSPEGEGEVTIISDRLDAVTLSVTGATQLTREGRAIEVADLALGQRVLSGAYDPISGSAMSLVVEPARSRQVRGEVTAIDEARMTVTITPGRGDPVQLLVLESTPTRIALRGNPNPRFENIEVGDRVRVALYDPDTLEAFRLVIT